MRHPWLVIVGTALPTLLVAQTARSRQTQTERGPYAHIAIMRALDGHSVELEAGYIRHLEWRRQAKDTFSWYSYSVWASAESIELFRILRETNLALLESLRPVQWKDYGVHSERGQESIERIFRFFAGHDINHLQQIEKILAPK